MKKIIFLMLVLGHICLDTFAQSKTFERADYTAGIDSSVNESKRKKLLFYASDEVLVTKDGASKRTVVRNHKLKTIDIRIKIKEGTKGRIIKTENKLVATQKYLPADAEIDSEDSVTVNYYLRIYWVKFDKRKKHKVVIPFYAGLTPSSETPFNPLLGVLKGRTVANAFEYEKHVYELDGSLTLQLSLKQIEELKTASGYGF